MPKRNKILICDLDHTLINCDSNRFIADLYGLTETQVTISNYVLRLISYDHKMAKVNFTLYRNIKADTGPVSRFGSELARYHKPEVIELIAGEIRHENPRKVLILTNCPSMLTKFMNLDFPHIAAPSFLGLVFTRGFKKLILSLYNLKYDIIHINDNPKELREGEYKNIFIS